MATLYITVFRSAGEVALGQPLQEMTVTVAAASATSAVVTGKDRQRNRIRLISDVDCFVTWGADPTAVGDGSAGRLLGKSNPEYFDIEAGHKIAVIEVP